MLCIGFNLIIKDETTKKRFSENQIFLKPFPWESANTISGTVNYSRRVVANISINEEKTEKPRSYQSSGAYFRTVKTVCFDTTSLLILVFWFVKFKLWFVSSFMKKPKHCHQNKSLIGLLRFLFIDLLYARRSCDKRIRCSIEAWPYSSWHAR